MRKKAGDRELSFAATRSRRQSANWTCGRFSNLDRIDINTCAHASVLMPTLPSQRAPVTYFMIVCAQPYVPGIYFVTNLIALSPDSCSCPIPNQSIMVLYTQPPLGHAPLALTSQVRSFQLTSRQRDHCSNLVKRSVQKG